MVMLRDASYCCTQEVPLAVLGGPYAMQETEFRLAVHLLAGLSLTLAPHRFLWHTDLVIECSTDIALDSC